MENEKRLVNAEAIARKLKYAHCTDCNVVRQIQCSACWVNDVLELLEGDSVDAAEVVHGRWEDEHGGKYANPRYRCSVCKVRALYKFERDLLDNWKEVQALTPVCPYCMAKLDGGNDDGSA